MISFPEYFLSLDHLNNNDSKKCKNIIYWRLLIKEVLEICIYFNNHLNHTNRIVKNINKILWTTSRYCIQKSKLSPIIPCLSASAEFTLESSPVKTWPVKPLPGEKRLNVPLPRSILLNLFIPVVMLNSWYSWWISKLQDDELNLIHFTPMKSLRQSLVSARVSSGSQSSTLILFPGISG